MRKTTPCAALILSTVLAGCSSLVGCSSAVDVLPLVKSVTVAEGQVSVVAFPSPAPAQLDGKAVADGSPIQMRSGQVLQVADAGQACSYKLVNVSGDTAQFRQTTSTLQPNGRWQRDTLSVRVIKSVGLTPAEFPRSPG